MFLLYLFVLQSAVAAVVQRAGEDVTLTCQHELEGQRDCNGTTWSYTPGRISLVALVELGKLKEINETEPDRLRVTADCSLMIKKVTVQDVGRYVCYQYKSDGSLGHIQVNWSDMFLSVATIVTEHEVDDEETLKCFVTSSDKSSKQEVKWKIKDQDIDDDNSQIKTEKNESSATVTLKKSHYLHPQSHFLSCEVTDSRTGEKLRFSPRPSGDTNSTVKPETFSKSTTTGTSGASADPQGDTKPTVKPETFTKSTTTGTSGASADPQAESTRQPEQTTAASGGDSQGSWWWLYLVVALGLIVLLITAVVIIRWKRTKGKKTVVDENTADAEDGISYATISYSKKTSSDVRAQGGDGETVTYSTVRASSSPAAASAEPSNLYSTIKFK
ncbi:uncharacterized protein LOC115402440 isoform X2 [Salarias fasciatus]|uniref:uncharacterized protein LOC115402440 isoform X2 n=1 Tax=Salarias fasciatus TaxID=181472 RepID=UPI001176E346|nr:uncharacterized protein LOC115402440 isoform X2 [Salarias fasciatus]